MLLQTLIVKTLLEAAKRAFWKNGAKGVPAVVDVLSVKHTTADPNINDELARAFAWVFRGVAVIVLVKLAQVAGFDITPYLHLIFQTATDAAVETVKEG